MNKLFVSFCALVIVAALAGVLFATLSDVSTQNIKLAKDFTGLQEQYDALQSNYYNLLGNFSSLKWNYTNILMQDPAQVPNPGLSGENDTYQTYENRMNALQDLYSSLKAEYEQYVADYQKLRSLTEQRLLRGSASVFITPDDPEVLSLARNVTGRTDNTTSKINWAEIKAIYDWVNNNIEYREDGLYPVLPYNFADFKIKGLEQTDQMAQLPNETLALKRGDCEDTAALLCSMLRAYFNKQYTVECIWITGGNAGHVAVVIPFSEDQIVILDPVRDYFSHDTLGDISLNSISTEIYNWINIWRPSLGNDAHVYRVFSDYMDKYFETSEEYITWMYNR